MRENLASEWRAALVNVRLRHPNPFVTTELRVTARNNDVRIEFWMDGLPNSRATHLYFDAGYYILANHWPGADLARRWVLSAWALLMEHEALEFSYLDDVLLADPHDHPWCARHREALERRHDMQYMVSRLGLAE